MTLIDARADADAGLGPLYAAPKKIHPQSVKGVFRRLKWRLAGLGFVVFYLLPFLRWNRGPNLPDQAVLFDFSHGRFFFFGVELWPQELYYLTGLMVVAALALFLSNALIGRAWCGFVCPQTVWTDVFVWVERRIEGERRERIRLDAAPWTRGKLIRKLFKHAAWLAVSASTGLGFVLYFADAPTILRQMATLQASLTPWMWLGLITATTYGLAGFLREQYCQYMCPWPRIQGALTDPDSLNVTYRGDRGEPKMSLKEAQRARAAGEPAGDCVDCNQCVAVCPAGVDIRLGLQPGCIQCGLCIDACDSVMTRLKRPTRLIGYDTDDNLRRRKLGEAPVYRYVRPRTLAYAAMIALAVGIMLYGLWTRADMGVTALHDRAPLYVTMHDGSVRNGYTLNIVNKGGAARTFAVSVEGVAGATLKCEAARTDARGRALVTVAPDTTQNVFVHVAASPPPLNGGSLPLSFRIVALGRGETATAADHFFGP